MKEKFTKVLLVIICILLVVCLFQIADLKNEMRNKYGHISNHVSNISNEINSISSNVAYQLEQEASIIAASSYEITEYDLEEMTVMLNYSVTPKEYSETRTVATIYVGDEPYPMTKDGATFTASVPVSIFEDSVVNKVAFREGDTVRTEVLDWWISPREEAVMRTYANLGGGWSGASDAEKKIYTITLNGSVELDVYTKTTSQIETIELAYYMDGKLHEIKNLDAENENGSRDNFWASIPVNDTVDIPYGSTLDICTIVTDSIGLRHLNIVERIIVNNSGTQHYDDNEWIWRAGEDIIYDKEGNCVFNPYEYNGHEINFEVTEL